MSEDAWKRWVIRGFGGIAGSQRMEEIVVGFHPEGITAISRGLSLRDTPGGEATKWDLHPEGMLADSICQPDGTLLTSLQDEESGRHRLCSDL